MIGENVAELERNYLDAQAACSTEFMRFAGTTSPRYSPRRLIDLSAKEARARRSWLEAKYGRKKP